MHMAAEPTLILLLVAVPVVGGLLCLALRDKKAIGTVVVITAIALIALSLTLFGFMTIDGVKRVNLEGGQVAPLGTLILLLDFVLMLVFLYVGYKEKSWLVILFGLLQLIPLALFELIGKGGEADPVMMVDFLSLIMALITSIVGSIICIYAIKYMEHDARQPRFFAVMILFLASMNGAVFSNHLLWFFFFWEATTLCSFLLIGHEKTEEARRSALRALKYTLGGGTVLVFGIILLEHYANTLLLSAIPIGSAITGLALLPIGLMCIPAFTKSAQVPFQNWLLGAMVAPTPVSALLHSATMVNLGVYFLLRLSPSIASVDWLQMSVAMVGATSFLSTSILAMAQSNPKRVLAYSTIGNLGLIAVCAAIGGTFALMAGILLLLFHALSKALLFMAVGVAKHEKNLDDIEAMEGLRDRMPFVTFALFAGVLTLLLPPFGMFTSKWMLTEVTVGYPVIAFFLAVGFAASIVYYTKWLGRVFATNPTHLRPAYLGEHMAPLFKWTLASLVFGTIALTCLLEPLVRSLIEPMLGPLPLDWLVINGSFGSFPMFPILLALGATLLLVLYPLRPKKEGLTDAYTGGEPFAFSISGDYLIGESWQRKATNLVNLLAVMLLMAIVLLPVLLEVMK
jgi:ech hydrogenase subunit A